MYGPVDRLSSFEPTKRSDGIPPLPRISPALMQMNNMSLQSLARSTRGFGITDLREALEASSTSNSAIARPTSISTLDLPIPFEISTKETARTFSYRGGSRCSSKLSIGKPNGNHHSLLGRDKISHWCLRYLTPLTPSYRTRQYYCTILTECSGHASQRGRVFCTYATSKQVQRHGPGHWARDQWDSATYKCPEVCVYVYGRWARFTFGHDKENRGSPSIQVSHPIRRSIHGNSVQA